MANGARLAMDSIAAAGAQNIHIVLKDTAGDPARAQAAAQEAIAEGARLILGPLRAGSVQSAGAVARAANIPLIGFSNTASAASEGVYLLSVLPEAETTRAISFASAQGGRSVIAFIPATAYGDAQDAALRLSASEMGFEIRQIFPVFNRSRGARGGGSGQTHAGFGSGRYGLFARSGHRAQFRHLAGGRAGPAFGHCHYRVGRLGRGRGNCGPTIS